MFNHLSSTELRLDLAEAEATKAKTLRAISLKRNRISEITNELLKRGAY
jgi:hypothetical protein